VYALITHINTDTHQINGGRKQEHDIILAGRPKKNIEICGKRYMGSVSITVAIFYLNIPLFAISDQII
jgi:hypothetical protein